MRRVGTLLVCAACGTTPARAPEVAGTSGTLDASVAPETPEVPATPGSADDVLGRLFDGGEPAIPRGFGGVRPGMSGADARRALPAAWKDVWEAAHPDERGVTLAVAVGDTGVVEALVVRFEQRAASARLEQVWGPADLRARHGGAVCWLASAARLKACYLNVDGRAVEIGSYVPLDEALAKGGRRAPASLVRFLGAPRRDVEKAFPEFAEVTVKDEPDRHHLAVRAPSTEYAAEPRYDRFAFFLDGGGKVREIEVRWGANDPALRPALVERVRAATAGLPASVTIVDDGPVDVVVVLDRDEGLR